MIEVTAKKKPITLSVGSDTVCFSTRRMPKCADAHPIDMLRVPPADVGW